jgi:hypothetical protein
MLWIGKDSMVIDAVRKVGTGERGRGPPAATRLRPSPPLCPCPPPAPPKARPVPAAHAAAEPGRGLSKSNPAPVFRKQMSEENAASLLVFDPARMEDQVRGAGRPRPRPGRGAGGAFSGRPAHALPPPPPALRARPPGVDPPLDRRVRRHPHRARWAAPGGEGQAWAGRAGRASRERRWLASHLPRPRNPTPPDYLRKVVLAGRSSHTTAVKQIMTPQDQARRVGGCGRGASSLVASLRHAPAPPAHSKPQTPPHPPPPPRPPPPKKTAPRADPPRHRAARDAAHGAPPSQRHPLFSPPTPNTAPRADPPRHCAARDAAHGAPRRAQPAGGR